MSEFDQRGNSTNNQYNIAGNAKFQNEPNWELYCPSKSECKGLIKIGKMPECFLDYRGKAVNAKEYKLEAISCILHAKNGLGDAGKQMDDGNFINKIFGAINALGGFQGFKNDLENGVFELYKCPFCDAFILYQLHTQQDGNTQRVRIGDISEQKFLKLKNKK